MRLYKHTFKWREYFTYLILHIDIQWSANLPVLRGRVKCNCSTLYKIMYSITMKKTWQFNLVVYSYPSCIQPGAHKRHEAAPLRSAYGLLIQQS